jgi:peroxiredoxin (alkyl hydroperoxide reductase subunit C)
LDQYEGKNLLLVFYPLDFTFVCPTEIEALNKRHKDFKSLNTEILCCSVDSHYSHKAWASVPREHGGFGGDLEIDLMSDLTKSISRDYGVLLEDVGISLRGTFLIDEKSVLKHISINDNNVGRNMDEYLRLVEAFNFSKKHGEVCPATWKKSGDPTMVTDHSNKKT